MRRVTNAAAIAGFFIFTIGFISLPACAQPAPPPPEQGYVPRNMDDLDELVGPVALYPDALLAQVFAACSYPLDVVSASQWLAAGNDPSRIDDQPWDLNVKGLAQTPDVLSYLAGHVDWMNDLGDAFINQQPDVMAAVQIMRGRANAAGNLVSNDDQQVVTDGDVIEIIPANPDVIYVPEYDPTVVYVVHDYRGGERWESPIRFGRGIRVGVWLHDDCDWRDRTIYTGTWGRDRPWWNHDRGGDHRYADVRPGVYQNIHNTTINRTTIIQSNRWTRDEHKPIPRAPVRGPDRSSPDRRPGTGYPARTVDHQPARVAAPEIRPGAITAHESARGQQSRERAIPKPHVEPAHVEPAHVQPHVEPKSEPKVAPRASSPPRGEASSGYQRGTDASHASDRGAASRGNKH